MVLTESITLPNFGSLLVKRTCWQTTNCKKILQNNNDKLQNYFAVRHLPQILLTRVGRKNF